VRRRLLRTCLRAYPRDLRERDGPELSDLAEDLAADHGVVREAVGLVRGGWAERRGRADRRRRAPVALTAATVSVLALLTWSAAAEPGRAEEDRFDCPGDCDVVEREVADRIAGGWTCIELPATASVTWRCTLD